MIDLKKVLICKSYNEYYYVNLFLMIDLLYYNIVIMNELKHNERKI